MQSGASETEENEEKGSLDDRWLSYGHHLGEFRIFADDPFPVNPQDASAHADIPPSDQAEQAQTSAALPQPNLRAEPSGQAHLRSLLQPDSRFISDTTTGSIGPEAILSGEVFQTQQIGGDQEAQSTEEKRPTDSVDAAPIAAAVSGASSDGTVPPPDGTTLVVTNHPVGYGPTAPMSLPAASAPTLDPATRAQTQLAESETEVAGVRAQIEADLAQGASQPLPSVAELIEPSPNGEPITAPDVPAMELAAVDWNRQTGAAAPSALPSVAKSYSAAPSVFLQTDTAAPSAGLIQRTAQTNGEEEAQDDYDPVVAQAQVRSIAAPLAGTPDQVQQQVETQAASIEQTILASGQTAQQAIQNSIEQKSAALQALFGQRRGALLVQVENALGQIDSTLQTTIEAATQKGEAAKGRLTDRFNKQRTDIEQVVADALVTVAELRQSRKTEAGQQIQARADESRRRGSAAAGKYGSDERGQGQSAAAQQVAEQTAANIAAEQPKIEQAIDQATKDIPAEINKQGQEARKGLDQGLPDLLRGVDQQVQTTITTAQQTAHTLKQQVQQMGVELGQHLETQQQTQLASLQALLPQASSPIQALLATVPAAMNAAVQQASSQIGLFTSQAHSTLVSIATPDVDASQRYVDQVLNFSLGAAGDVSAALQEVSGPVDEQLAQVQTTIDTAATALETQAGTSLDTLSSGFETGLGNVLAVASTQFHGLVAGLDTPFGEVERSVDRDFNNGLTKLQQDTAKTIQGADQEVLKAIDQGVAKADEALGGLDGKMNEAAEEAGWRYDHPVLATLKDIGGFVAGLVVGIVVVLALAAVVIIAAQAIIAGLVALGMASAVASWLVAIVGLGLLAFGVYQAYQARVAAGEEGGLLTGLKSLGDVLGITDIYNAVTDSSLTPFERGLGTGRGLASIALIFTGGRFANLIKGRLPTIIANPTRGMAWNWRARGPLDLDVPTSMTRPSHAQSEIDVSAALPEDFASQRSFLNNQEVPYGTPGSTRPDNYRSGGWFKPPVSVEVKNYNVTTSSGRSNLISEVSEQAIGRAVGLPNTPQKIVIDVRGQNVSQQTMNSIVERIVQRSNGILRETDIQFLR